jgi:hypothetical protein
MFIKEPKKRGEGFEPDFPDIFEIAYSLPSDITNDYDPFWQYQDSEFKKLIHYWQIRAGRRLGRAKMHLSTTTREPKAKRVARTVARSYNTLFSELRACAHRHENFAKGYSDFPELLWIWYDHLHNHLYSIVPLLEEDHGSPPYASAFLVEFAAEVISLIDNYISSNPKVAESVASRRLSWPAMVSKFPGHEELCAPIKGTLGKSLLFPVDTATRWKPRDPVTRVAAQILLAAQNYRACVLSFSKYPRFPLKQFSKSAQEAAMLGSFGSETAASWWSAVGAKAFKHYYPDPASDPRLTKFIKRPGKATKGRFAAIITATVRSRFLSLAGGH